MAVAYNGYSAYCNTIKRWVNGSLESTERAGLTDWDYFEDAPTAGDAIYFANGIYSPDGWNVPSGMKFFVGTQMAGTDIVLIWEYYRDDKSWQPLANVVDNTNGFTVAGENTVTWDPPAHVYIFGDSSTGGIKLYVRCRLVSFTTVTEGGAQSTQKVMPRDNTIRISGYSAETPCTCADIFTYMDANHPGAGCINEGAFYDFPVHFTVEDDAHFETKSEMIYLGNNNGFRVQFSRYPVLSGITIAGELVAGTDRTENGSMIFIRNGKYASNMIDSGPNCKYYGTTIRSIGENMAGEHNYGYMGHRNDTWIDCVFSNPESGGWADGSNAIMTRCFLNGRGNVGLITVGPGTYDGVVIYFSGMTRLINVYYISFSLKNLTYIDRGSLATLFYLYQTRADNVFDCVNLSSAMPGFTDTPKPVQRYIPAQGDIPTLYNYDNTSGFTDETAEARDAATDDVHLTGKTGAPEVGDCLYFDLGTTSSDFYAKSVLYVTMGSVVNSDNTYVWETYTGGAWVETDVWDMTENFTQSGYVYVSKKNALQSVAVNGKTSKWMRARITVAGSSLPLASKITSANEAGVSKWQLNEKFELDLEVIDKDGNAIEGANVTVKNANDDELTGTTDADGKITTMEVTASRCSFDPDVDEYQEMKKITFNPQVLTISKRGYETYRTEFDATQKMDWVIKLKRSPYARRGER